MASAGLFCKVSDREWGLLGYLAIDRFIDGSSCGGIRWGPSVSREEIEALSYDMTLKYGFCNIPLGGAKSGIIAPSELSPGQKRKRLLAFGRQLGPLLRSGAYIPGADLGTSHQDMLTVLEGAGLRQRNPENGSAAGYFTGYGVVQAILVALRRLGLKPEECTAGIDGFGKVGGTIVELLAERGVSMVAVATKYGALFRPEGLPVKELLSWRDSPDPAWVQRYPNAERMPLEGLYTLPMDILIPCAGPWVINEGNVARVKAKAVVPGANIPATREVQVSLEKRGVLYLPDSMCNCAGVMANALAWKGLTREQIERFLREVLALRMERILHLASVSNQSPVVVAEQFALRNVERLERFSEEKRRSRWARASLLFRDPERLLLGVASRAYRRGGSLARWLAPLAWQEAVRAFERDTPD